MNNIELKNKPLVEAIFELQWHLQEQAEKVFIDPHYSILLGSFYQEVKSDYPYLEKLVSATVPDEITPHTVKYRFRKEKNEWPLIQIGPGIISLNETSGYIWSDFNDRIHKSVEALFKTYPHDDLVIKNLQLRYIDAIDFDYANENIYDFMKNHMKIELNINRSLFEDSKVEYLPNHYDLGLSFKSEIPEGLVSIRFSRGKIKSQDSVIWETIVNSQFKSLSEKEKVFNWVEKAHDLTHKWFFKTIEGELYRRFK